MTRIEEVSRIANPILQELRTGDEYLDATYAACAACERVRQVAEWDSDEWKHAQQTHAALNISRDVYCRDVLGRKR